MPRQGPDAALSFPYSTGWSGHIDLDRLARLQQAGPVDPRKMNNGAEFVAVQGVVEGDDVRIWESLLPAGACYFPPAMAHVVTLCLTDMPDVVWCQAGLVQSGALRAGELMIRRADKAMFCHSETAGRFLHLTFTTQYLQSVCNEVVEVGQVVTLRDGVGVCDPALGSLLQALRLQLQAQRPFSRAFVNSVARAVCVYLGQHHVEATTLTKGLSDRELHAVIDHMRSHMACSDDIVDVASRLGMSAACLARRFKQRTGDSLGRYSLRLRLAQAHELLKSARHSVTDVAMATGFADLPHFSRQFRKHFGLPPSALRCR